MTDHFAKEAERLLQDDTLAEAMTRVRTKALVALLAAVNADDKTEMQRQAGIANCLSDVRDELEAAILATGKSDGGFNPNAGPEKSTAAH